MWALLLAIASNVGAACPQTCVAWGASPRWSIQEQGGRWALRVEGQPAVEMAPGLWRDTPRGRRMTGVIKGENFTLVATFGQCGMDATSSYAEMTATYFARVTLPGGVTLLGCMNGDAYGPVPEKAAPHRR